MIAGLLGLLFGLIGVGVALYAAGFFNYLGGKKRNPAAISKEILTAGLLALNDPSKPYQIVKGADTDLLAEWKIVDASWYGIFNKSGLKQAYRARLLLDESRKSVRCYEELGSVNWSAGMKGLTPSIHYQQSFFGGRILFKKEWGVGYGLKEPISTQPGKVYEYTFDIDTIRKPIITAVKESGWEWVPVTAKRHATYQQPISAAEHESGICIQCGNKLGKDDVFCVRCGQKIDNAGS